MEITEWLIVTVHSSLCAVQGVLNETALPPPALLQFNFLCKLNLPGGFPKQEASFLNRGTRGSDYLILAISVFFFFKSRVELSSLSTALVYNSFTRVPADWSRVIDLPVNTPESLKTLGLRMRTDCLDW